MARFAFRFAFLACALCDANALTLLLCCVPTFCAPACCAVRLPAVRLPAVCLPAVCLPPAYLPVPHDMACVMTEWAIYLDSCKQDFLALAAEVGRPIGVRACNHQQVIRYQDHSTAWRRMNTRHAYLASIFRPIDPFAVV